MHTVLLLAILVCAPAPTPAPAPEQRPAPTATPGRPAAPPERRAAPAEKPARPAPTAEPARPAPTAESARPKAPPKRPAARKKPRRRVPRHLAPLMGLSPEEDAALRWPRLIGPFGLVSKDERNALFIGFAGQTQLLYENRDEGPGFEREQRLKPLLRRIRLTFLGSVFQKSLLYYLQLSTAPGSLELMDYWVEWGFADYARLRIGQQKVPFSRHRTGSFKNLTFVDWSLVSPAFGEERQLGLALHGINARPSWLDWSIGLFTGVNQRRSHAVGVAQTFGEPVPNPSDLVDPAPVEEFHPAIVARAGYRFRDVVVGTDTDWNGGPLRLYTGAGLAWDLDASPVRDFALRAVAELMMKVRHVSLALSGYLGLVRRLDGKPLQVRWAMWGLLAQGSYLIKRKVELSLRYALVERGKGLLHTARTRADDLIAAALPADRPALVAQYTDAGRIRRQHEATFGVNVYLIGRSLKWQTDVSWLPTQYTDDGYRHDVRVRSQLQLAF